MRFIMAVFMLALVLGGTWQIFTKMILNNPSTVTDEFLRYVLIWASLIGSAYCFYRDEHLLGWQASWKAAVSPSRISSTGLEPLVAASRTSFSKSAHAVL